MLLYIHIPFCASKCGYCGFASFVGKKDYFIPYINALCDDIAHHLNMFSNTLIHSIFIGGGTPSLLPTKLYECVFHTINKHAKIAKDCEITFEANINHLSKQWCEAIYALGANRMSIGIESFNAKKLMFLEREHKEKDIEKLIQVAYNAGFRQLSCDLIIDTPFCNAKDLKIEIKRASKLPLNHISVYSLSVDEGSRFEKQLDNASNNNLKAKYTYSHLKEGYVKLVREYLLDAGFIQYEVSNYAKRIEPSIKKPKSTQSLQVCKHNVGYWRGEKYIGCGLGAVSCVGHIRSTSHNNLDMYIKAPIYKNKEILSDDDIALERLMLGLRCIDGVALDSYITKEAMIKMLIDDGLCALQMRKNQAFLVANELFLCDEIVLWLLKRGYLRKLKMHDKTT